MGFKSYGSNEPTYEVVEKIGVIDEATGLELNVVAWNGRAPKYDLRPWRDGKPSKGITLTAEQLGKLYEILEAENGKE